MTWVAAENVGETTTTTGTGSLFLDGPGTDKLGIASVAANGDVFAYSIQHSSLAEYEDGIGRWNAGGSLDRIIPIKSSNGGALVDLSAGTKTVTLGVVPRVGTPAFSRNLLTNGGFQYAQRQALTTVTVYSNIGGRSPTADRWWVSNENLNLDYAAVDTAGAAESKLRSRYYGRLRKTTNAGKFMWGQVVDTTDTASIRGRIVRVALKMRRTPNAMPIRVGLVQLTSAGTADLVPTNADTWVTAGNWGANGTDPTLGTNLAYIAPLEVQGGVLSGSAMTVTVGASLEKAAAHFLVPTDCKNVVPVIWAHNQLAVNDILHFAEWGLYDTLDVEWMPAFPGEDQLRCFRRYQKSFEQPVAPASSTGLLAGAARSTVVVGGAVAGQFQVRLPVTMVAPGISKWSYFDGSFEVRNITRGTNATGTAIANVADNSFLVTYTGAAGWVAGDDLALHWVALNDL